ncbi:hypothetical protein [Sphingomicrobium sediminis]|uniref:Secreted protein n=1 Tax=Sphingomicrobium sediminis TaxID=2950949 RepID=A0A9X2EGQ0_9SPHN|nr:hypothetical protein [Sphingomicrobium sediminis]MCM8557700.1 hypothetical protein [Sphingomicrobium sediminis]
MKSKFLTLAGAALGTVGAAAMIAGPATAQDQPRRNIIEVVVFGDDPCPRSTEDEVVICARKDESERYRIPEELRDTGSRQSRQSWVANARYLETVNETGISRCSPVGPAGAIGCLNTFIEQGRIDREDLEERESVPE